MEFKKKAKHRLRDTEKRLGEVARGQGDGVAKMAERDLGEILHREYNSIMGCNVQYEKYSQ